jgi:hypothetical protein
MRRQGAEMGDGDIDRAAIELLGGTDAGQRRQAQCRPEAPGRSFQLVA